MIATFSSYSMYYNSAKTPHDLQGVSIIKLAVGFISNLISSASHHNLHWSARWCWFGVFGGFLWEQDWKVNDTLSFILSGTGPGTQPAVWKLISPCLNPLLCRTLSKCFKSCASWECFHVSVPRPFILQGRVLSTRKNLRRVILSKKYSMSGKKPPSALQATP